MVINDHGGILPFENPIHHFHHFYFIIFVWGFHFSMVKNGEILKFYNLETRFTTKIIYHFSPFFTISFFKFRNIKLKLNVYCGTIR